VNGEMKNVIERNKRKIERKKKEIEKKISRRMKKKEKIPKKIRNLKKQKNEDLLNPISETKHIHLIIDINNLFLTILP